MQLVYEKTIVEAAHPQDVNGAADGNYICMKGYDHCTIIIQTGALAGASAITVNRATDVSATGEVDLEFDYMWTNDGATALSPLTKTDVTGDTFDIDTANSMYVIEIPADTIQGSSTTAYDCIQLAFGAASASTIVSAVYVLSKGRYKSDVPIEPLAD